MSPIEIIEIPTKKNKVKIDGATKKKLLEQTEEESQVIIHFSITGRYEGDKIRVWKTTFLYAKDSSHISKLVHVENVTIFPVWTPVLLGQTIVFTLIFSGLPKDCKQFDLVEQIPEPGAWIVNNIVRNNTDVYFLDLDA